MRKLCDFCRRPATVHGLDGRACRSHAGELRFPPRRAPGTA